MEGKIKELEEKKVVMNFDSKLFRKEAIIEAASDYTESFWMLVEGSDDSIFVVLIPKEGSVEKKKIEDEFYNYVLASTKNIQFN